MKIKKSEFLEDVRHEIEMLREHASLKEIAKLNLSKFNAMNREECIYGQMTGSCESSRAKTLMSKACIRTFNIGSTSGTEELNGETFSSISKFINGEYSKKDIWNQKSVLGGYNRDFYYLSALEGYITLKNAKIKNILDYLQGKRKDLVL